MIRQLTFATDLGRLYLAWRGSGICALGFADGFVLPEEDLAPAWVLGAVRRLMGHLGGRPEALEDIPLDLASLAPFQHRVLTALRDTRPGETVTYGELALRVGQPGAARAVGQAVKANPILILVPCHRVVGARGPGGWSAFGSPERKARLLALEGVRGG